MKSILIKRANENLIKTTYEWPLSLKTSVVVIFFYECLWLAGQKMSISHQDNGACFNFFFLPLRTQTINKMQSACISDLQVIMQPPAGIDLALPQIIGLPDSCGVNMPKNNIWMWAVVLICLQWMICGLITEFLPAEDAAWRLSVSRTIITMNKLDKRELLSLYRLGRIKPPFYLQITSFIYWKKALESKSKFYQRK